MFAPKRPERDGFATGDRPVAHQPVVLNEVVEYWLRLAGFTPWESQRLTFLRRLYERGQLTEFPPER